MVLLVIRRLDPVSVKLDGEAGCVEKVGYKKRMDSFYGGLERLLLLPGTHKVLQRYLTKEIKDINNLSKNWSDQELN